MAAMAEATETKTGGPVDVKGHCYCGGVQFRVRIPADEECLFRAYCFCDSCRRAHSSPIYQVVYTHARNVEVEKGAELLTHFCKNPEKKRPIIRSFCSVCGSRVLNEHPEKDESKRVLGFFPSLLGEDVQSKMPVKLLPNTLHLPEDSVLVMPLLEELK